MFMKSKTAFTHKKFLAKNITTKKTKFMFESNINTTQHEAFMNAWDFPGV